MFILMVTKSDGVEGGRECEAAAEQGQDWHASYIQYVFKFLIPQRVVENSVFRLIISFNLHFRAKKTGGWSASEKNILMQNKR